MEKNTSGNSVLTDGNAADGNSGKPLAGCQVVSTPGLFR